jgi:DNA polymerase eta
MRTVVHLDLDCFFVQVERSLNPSLCGKPVAVQQHQDLICISYEARALGVQKHMSPAEAKRKAPGITLVHVPLVGNTRKVLGTPPGLNARRV